MQLQAIAFAAAIIASNVVTFVLGWYTCKLLSPSLLMRKSSTFRLVGWYYVHPFNKDVSDVFIRYIEELNGVGALGVVRGPRNPNPREPLGSWHLPNGDRCNQKLEAALHTMWLRISSGLEDDKKGL